VEAGEAMDEEQNTAIGNLDIFPLGSIIPWVNKPEKDSLHQEELPDGWVLCDGSVIPKGVWQGSHTPNLNEEGRFVRGGNPEQVLTMESHSIEDHNHIDNGHTHQESGHSHPYQDCGYRESWACHDGCHGNTAFHYCETKTSSVAKANIQASNANIAGIGNMGHAGSETRPINMRVIWIMKAW